MEPAPVKELITFEDLERLDIRVGTIMAVAEVEASNKLMRLTVDFGDHTRSILAGEFSQGMLFDIGYADGVTPCLAVPERPVPDGSRAG